ncbi:hydrolase [Rhodococcus sp. PAMC28707]|uniref:zinc-dependent metalloprotease n=1 Tax=unclassified Rhodococcus (in: high G+C Gram-positive bacteria) TaxID=192944 RepID=UPI00109E3019|nr:MULTISPECIES: zinc-dependent metalloprotease [unclassified Rhodococcus (in: high G+C Gram-positive bacteria)]QCB49142.1 hydrolase [Rhodococcus sp. PAMC28705]QCB59170.1 hydrolase [Rhodococcus sp. PAMC28707]
MTNDAADTEGNAAGFRGSVDWALAAKTGAKLAPKEPSISRYTAEAVVAELSEASVRAEGPVRETTGLADGLPVPQALVVDRAGWIDAAAASMKHLTGDTDAEPPTGLLGGKPAGLQAGAMLAFLSSAILGQYDPFTGEHGTLLLVAPNIVAVERALRVPPSDFRLWVCLHEVTHRVQFSSAPWLGDYMRSSVAVLSDGVDEPIGEFATRLTSALKNRKQSNKAEDAGIVGLLRATQAPAQREAIDRLLVLGTLLEGHADHVMDAVGPAVVPSVLQIRQAFERRRRRKTNPLQRVIRALLGMDAKMAQYVRGKSFVDHVVGRVGMEQFNIIWTDASTLPLLDEIEDPDRWIARVLR